MDKLTRKLIEDMTPEQKQKSKEIKARVKARLLQSFPVEVVAKGLARAERWMKAAYGRVDYVSMADESGEESIGGWYCSEVAAEIEAGGITGGSETSNRQTFGIQKNWRGR